MSFSGVASFVSIASEPSAAASTRRTPLILLGSLLAIWLLTAAWPGDIPFINDEPRFIYKALRANQRHELEGTGLTGSIGIPYGPLPVWMYQLMLLITHHLPAIVFLHALLINGLIIVALLWLARTLRLNSWFVLVVMASPYTWFYSRALWDSLNLPLSALALAAYASNLMRPTWQKLLLTIGCIALMPLVHPMSGALVLPIIVHLLIVCRRQLIREWPMLVGAAAGAVIVWSPYLRALAPQEANGMHLAGPGGWWFPLLGARLISNSGLDYLFGVDWFASAGRAERAALWLAWAVSLGSYLLFWIGLLAGGLLSWKLLHGRRQFTTLEHLLLIATGTIAVQCVLDGLLHIFKHPHYYGGTWVVIPLLAWIGLEVITRRARLMRFLPVPLFAALACTTIFIAISIHQNRGMRTVNYGACLAEEMRVVREINTRDVHGPFLMLGTDGRSVADDPFNFGNHIVLAAIHTNVLSFLNYPYSLNVIQELTSPGPAAAPEGLWLAIISAEDTPTSARLSVVRIVPPRPQ
jgi:hypothetical protein